MSSKDYADRYLNHIFRLRRRETQWVAPLLANEPFKHLTRLALSRDGAMVFEAEAKKEGMSIFREGRQGGFSQWQDKTWDAFETGGVQYPALIGNQFLGIFRRRLALREGSIDRRFLTLDMESGEWRAMGIPPLITAKAMPVTLK